MTFQLTADELVLLDAITDDFYGFWEIPIEFFCAAAGAETVTEEITRSYRAKVVDWT